jgi:hypothetical protein
VDAVLLVAETVVLHAHDHVRQHKHQDEHGGDRERHDDRHEEGDLPPLARHPCPGSIPPP